MNYSIVWFQPLSQKKKALLVEITFYFSTDLCNGLADRAGIASIPMQSAREAGLFPSGKDEELHPARRFSGGVDCRRWIDHLGNGETQHPPPPVQPP